MSTSAPPAAGNSMRQQLDELDALLQRMLELPVNQLDEATPAAEPPRRVVEPRRTAVAPPAPPAAPRPAPAAAGWRPPLMVLLADSGPVPQPTVPPETWDQGWSINLNPQQGSSVLGPRSPAAAATRPPANNAIPTPPPVWRAETVTYVPAAAPARPQAQPVPAPVAVPIDAEPAVRPRPPYRPAVPPPTPLLLLPLVGLNRTFDGVVTLFGPPGRWLRSPFGRTALGVGGLLMLAGGVAWGVLDWIGWTW